MMALAALLGAVSTVGGLYLSYYLRASSGATIVLLATLLFFAAVSREVRRPAHCTASVNGTVYNSY